MSINQTQSALDQCIVHYDTYNKKSYIGPSLTNLIRSMTPSGNGSSTSWASRTGTDNVYIPSLGFTDIKWYDIMNDYNNVYGAGSSNNCCPTLFSFGDCAVSPSTLYTYAMVYKSSDTYASSNYMYRYEYTVWNGTYLTEAGVYTTGNRIYLGDGWYWAWGTFTTQATCNYISFMGMFHYQYTLYTRMQLAKIMLVKGDYTQLHPKYWPGLNETRLPTASLKDLKGNIQFDITNIKYDLSGNMLFDGLGSYIDGGSNSILSVGNSISVVVWFYMTGNVGTYMVLASKLMAGYTLGWELANSYGLLRTTFRPSATQINLTGSTSLLVNRWYQAVMTFDGLNCRLFLNGNVEANINSAGPVTLDSSANLQIGARFASNTFTGYIPSVQIYNRALTKDEITNNFNLTRGRFGI